MCDSHYRHDYFYWVKKRSQLVRHFPVALRVRLVLVYSTLGAFGFGFSTRGVFGYRNQQHRRCGGDGGNGGAWCRQRGGGVDGGSGGGLWWSGDQATAAGVVTRWWVTREGE
nr:hypothetical protein [Tanacetum cinerariifolium]